MRFVITNYIHHHDGGYPLGLVGSGWQDGRQDRCDFRDDHRCMGWRNGKEDGKTKKKK